MVACNELFQREGGWQMRPLVGLKIGASTER